MKTEISLNKQMVRLLTEKCLRVDIADYKAAGKGSFVMPELIGSIWGEEYMPFYWLYESEKVAGQEMGKLLSKVADDLGLESRAEDKRGKKNAITRYFF